MSKSPSRATAAKAPAAAAAASFADGHVDPVATSLPLGVATADEVEADLVALRQTDPAPQGGQVTIPKGITVATARVPLAMPATISTRPPGHILILCGTPGFRRAGFAHPSRAEYPLDSFTGEQLASIRAEPVLELVEIGGTATPRATRLYGVETLATAAIDPLLAGRAAADAISRPPNRAEPGLRNAVAGRL